MELHDTIMGQKFFGTDIPTIATELENINAFLQTVPQMVLCIEELLNIVATQDVTQSMITPEEVDDYLRNGWRFVNSFSNGRETFVIVETEKRG